MSLSIDQPKSVIDAAATNSRGVLAMLSAMAFFCVGDALIKLVGRDLPVGQIMFARGFIASAIVLCLIAYQGHLGQFRNTLTPLMSLRTLCEIGATITFFSGLVRLPFADCNAIAQFMPLAVTALAALLLKEAVGWRRWLAAVVGLIGVLIIIRPGTSAFDWNALWIVGTVFFVALRDVITRRIGPGLSPFVVAAVSVMATTMAGAAMAPLESWVQPTPLHIAQLTGAAVMILGGLTYIVQAMRQGEVAVVAPFRYTAIIFAVTIGYVVFGEVPDNWTFVGLAVVVSAGIYTFHREGVRRRQAAARAAGVASS